MRAAWSHSVLMKLTGEYHVFHLDRSGKSLQTTVSVYEFMKKQTTTNNQKKHEMNIKEATLFTKGVNLINQILSTMHAQYISSVEFLVLLVLLNQRYCNHYETFYFEHALDLLPAADMACRL